MQGGRTPLLIAAEKGYIELVRKLAGQYDGDIFHTMKVRTYMEVLLLYMYSKYLHLHAHACSLSRSYALSHVHTPLLQNSRNALHLAAYRGHLPVLQYLCPMFGDRVLDKDGNGETCLDIARRLGRDIIAEFLIENYPQLERKVGLGKA